MKELLQRAFTVIEEARDTLLERNAIANHLPGTVYDPDIDDEVREEYDELCQLAADLQAAIQRLAEPYCPCSGDYYPAGTKKCPVCGEELAIDYEGLKKENDANPSRTN